MLSKRFYGPALFAAVLALPVLTGCPGEDNPLCCSEFKVGATVDANIGGGAESKVAVQAVADFAGIASAAIDDLTTACRSIAQDLDAPADKRAAAEAMKDRQAKMKEYCSLAVSAIGTVKASAGGKLTIVAKPPACQASVSAKANCQANCSGSAKCDLEANPPKCTGGKLEVSCSGGCTAEAGATLKCEGSCTGTCKGSCTAKGGVSVKCDGKCEGTCKASGGAGNGGIQADGSCKGECDGTCTARAEAPAVECSGSCNGECSASCKAEAGASVKCDGKCDAKAEPLKCEGGKLEGGCKVEAKCDANCDASVSAKAECTPPEITVQFSGAANADAAGKLVATLKANLGVVLAFKSRLEGMVAVTGTFKANISAVTDIKAACIPLVVASVGSALTDVAASAQAAGSVAGSVTTGG
jgi:hypothetical protein